MARLTVSLLGSFGVELDGKPVTAFSSDKVRALLAYLVTETGRPHRRETLAGLLWPDWPERSARANLRKVLGDLQAAQAERESSPLLIITRQTVQFNAESDHRVDVAAFQRLVDAHPENETISRRLEKAVGLYRGPFLEGFSLADSPTFEEWALGERERLQRQVLAALQQLIAAYEEQDDLARACEFAWRQVELAPWHEQAHRALMRLLALSGQRGAALAQYESCRRALKEELDVEPGEETQRLYQRIRSNDLRQSQVAPGRVSEPGLQPPLYERIRDGELGPPPEVTPAQETALPAASPAQAEGVATPPPPAQPGSPPEKAPTAEQRKTRLEGERRTVTALVVCIRETAAQGTPIDVETWAEAMNRLLPVLEAGIARYGGEVERYRGKDLIALFGASAAHEDDPERALLAALAIRKEIQPALAGLARRERVHLALRVGIHTGEAVVTSTGDRAHYWAAPVVDPALALAETTDRSSEPSAVLVTEQTYRLAAPLFEWDAPDASAVYRARAHKGIAGKGRGIEGLSSPLVGRDAELHALQNALASLRDGIGGIVTVVGPAGIGKSRLVAEAQKSPNLRWLEGRCLSYATNVAYQLWQDLLRSWLDVPQDAPPLSIRDTLRERVRALCGDGFDQVYPYLGRLLALPLEDEIEDGLRGLDAASLQFITFHAVETLLERIVAERPLAVVCEDLHWADATSLALLERLLSLADRVPLLFVCVLRPERAHGCWQIVEAAARDYAHSHTSLTLEPLSHAASATLIGNLLRIEDLSETIRTRILAHAEGNPFYLEELLRTLIDGAIIVYNESSGRWQAIQDIEDIPIPDTLHGVLAARIDRLPAETRRVLQLASVIGRSFSHPILSAVYSPLQPPRSGGGEGRESLDAHLVALQRAQLIRQRRRVPEREYTFKHHLTQEAAYGSLLRRERRATHRQVTEALETLYPDRIEEQLGLLAHHWEQAGDVERAFPYLRRAGEQAAAQYANEEAIGYLSRALELAPQDDLETRFALLLAREGVYHVRGTRQAQQKDLETLQALAEALDGDGRKAEVAWRLARYALMLADHPAAIAAAQEAVRLAQAAHDVESEAQAHLYWGWVLYRERDWEATTLQLQQALTLAQAASLHRIEADALLRLAQFHRRQEDFVTAVAHFKQAIRLFRQTGDRRGEGTSLHNLGAAYYHLGDAAQARTCCEQALHILRQIGERVEEGWTLYYLGEMCEYESDYAQALCYCEQALAVFGETDAQYGHSQALMTLAEISAQVGDYARAHAYCEQTLELHHKTAAVENRLTLLRGRLSHYQGDHRAARECTQQVRQSASDRDQPVYEAMALVLLGHALSGLGRVADAIAAYRQSAALYHELVRFQYAASSPLAELARVAWTKEEQEQALAHVGEILGILETRPKLEGLWEPGRVYLSCYHVLHANQDPSAGEILAAAYRLIQERASKIDDQALRRSYLENVAENREIVALWEGISHP